MASLPRAVPIHRQMFDYHSTHSSAQARIVSCAFYVTQNRTLQAQQLPVFVIAVWNPAQTPDYQIAHHQLMAP